MKIYHWALIIAIAVLLSVPRNTQAQLYILQNNTGKIGIVSKYSTDGELINANFITGLDEAGALVVSGNTLFVIGNAVGKYDATTGGALNASFIPLPGYALALSNNSLFVLYYSYPQGYTVGKYDATTGEAINANFITGLDGDFELMVLGNKLFVSNGNTVGKYNATTGAAIDVKFIKGLDLLAAKNDTLFGLVGIPRNTIAEYDATNGIAINPSLITGLKNTTALAVLGDRVFVADSLGTIGEYDTTTGVVINRRLITGLMTFPVSIAIKRAK